MLDEFAKMGIFFVSRVLSIIPSWLEDFADLAPLIHPTYRRAYLMILLDADYRLLSPQKVVETIVFVGGSQQTKNSYLQ